MTTTINPSLGLRMLLAVSLSGLHPLVAWSQPAVAEAWHPQPEPPPWVLVRKALLRAGPPDGLSQRPWVFLRAFDQPDFRVAEYFADLSTGADPALLSVEFTGVMLLQVPNVSPH